MAMHEPVMVAEALEWLAPARGGTYLDCTVGLGGHARALLDAGADRVIGLDRDQDALARAGAALAPWATRVDLIHADFRSVAEVLAARGVDGVDGALADLGVSSLQLDDEARGFSFRQDAPLDMRMDRSTGPTAAELLRTVSETELADVIFRFGEERFARRIARAVVATRRHAPIETTGALASIVRRAMPRRGWQRIDPATRTFQALRIWVNRELEGLDGFLGDVTRLLRAGARLVVIAFHSLEDRIVKHTFRALEKDAGAALRILTRRPAVPGEAEIAGNPRARSAKLRAVERVA
jgi:16S rRNA (cytosine1402-N4)-methyltransferase